MAMRIFRNKRGMFFTIIAIILVASLMFFYVSNSRHSQRETTRVIETRVMTMDSFIDDIDHDIERGLYISSMRALIGLSEYTARNGTFVPNITASFNEIMINGTLNTVQLNITSNATFGIWTNKIIDIGRKLDIDVQFLNIKLLPYQVDPWAVKINILGELVLMDRKGLASWNRTLNVTTTIDITDFEDPLYTIISEGKLTNKIIKSNFTDFVSGSDASNLIREANDSLYIHSTAAPDFLMRLSGNFSASPYGIESIVNIDKIKVAIPDIYYPSKSTIDYIYFGNTTHTSCKVNETKNVIAWFRLDDVHLPVYEATCES